MTYCVVQEGEDKDHEMPLPGFERCYSTFRSSLFTARRIPELESLTRKSGGANVVHRLVHPSGDKEDMVRTDGWRNLVRRVGEREAARADKARAAMGGRCPGRSFVDTMGFDTC